VPPPHPHPDLHIQSSQSATSHLPNLNIFQREYSHRPHIKSPDLASPGRTHTNSFQSELPHYPRLNSFQSVPAHYPLTYSFPSTPHHLHKNSFRSAFPLHLQANSLKSAPPYHPHINSSQSALSHHSKLNTFQTLHSHLAHTNNSHSAPPRYATAHHAKPFTPTPNAITSSTSPIPQHTKPRAHRAYDPSIINDTKHQPPRSHPNHPYLAPEHSRPIAPNEIAPIPTISSTHTGHHSELPPSSPTKRFIYANIIEPTKRFIYANTTTLPPHSSRNLQ
jgi:hypothetical protein